MGWKSYWVALVLAYRKKSKEDYQAIQVIRQYDGDLADKLEKIWRTN